MAAAASAGSFRVTRCNDVPGLFADLGERIAAIYQAESSAIARLTELAP